MTSKRIISGIVALSMLTGMLPADIAHADDSPANMTLTKSNTSGGLTITLKIKDNHSAPAAPTKASVTQNSITLTAVDGCEYSKDGTAWQDSPEFTGLTPGAEYKFYQRVKETDDANASAASPALTVSTEAVTSGLTITLVIPHTHDFSYTASGNTITASCTGSGDCELTTGLTMMITAPTGDLTYDGTAKAATLNDDYNKTAFPGTYTIEYSGRNGTTYNSTTAPTNAGDYTASVTAEGETASVDFTIAKATARVTITGNRDATVYDGSEHTVSGYDVRINDPVYTAADFTFSGTAEAKLTDIGMAQMGLTSLAFTNENANFDVTFYVTDGYQHVLAKQGVTVTITGKPLPSSGLSGGSFTSNIGSVTTDKAVTPAPEPSGDTAPSEQTAGDTPAPSPATDTPAPSDNPATGTGDPLGALSLITTASLAALDLINKKRRKKN